MSETGSLVSDERISRRFRGARPVTAYVKPSDYCNVGCEHCYLPLAVRADRATTSRSAAISPEA